MQDWSVPGSILVLEGYICKIDVFDFSVVGGLREGGGSELRDLEAKDGKLIFMPWGVGGGHWESCLQFPICHPSLEENNLQR